MPVDVKPFFVSGGTLPLGSRSYIERSADEELLDDLVAGRYCYVLNARQMGKSSLCVRTMAHLAARGVRTVFLDLTQIGGSNVQVSQWYAGLTAEVGRQTGLSRPMLAYFKDQSQMSPMQRFFSALREIVLERIAEPVVILIDEIDATRSLTFGTDEFFAGIRECFNRRVLDDRFARLTFCLLGVAVPKDLIRDPATTPFNIGERITLRDLDLNEVLRYGSALGRNGARLAARVHFWTNGQPFLTQSVCHELVAEAIEDEAGVDALVERLFFGPKAIDVNLNLADVANRALNDTSPDGDPDVFRANLLSAYEQIWKGGSLVDDEANRVAVVLKLSGLVRPEGSRLVLRNRIYRQVFDRAWIRANMPGQEVVRQRKSFRRGIVRGIAMTAVFGGIVGALAFLALQSRAKAIEAQAALDSELYIADMNSLRLFEDSGDTTRMSEILARLAVSPHRGFEWNLWMGRLHDAAEEYTLDYSAPGKIEEGFLSADGSQVCIEDDLAGLSVVVDRKTKRALGTLPFMRGRETDVIAESNGIVSVDHVDAPAPVTELTTGRVLCRIGTPGFHIEDVGTPTRTDIIVLKEERRPAHSDTMIELWNLRTGKRVLRHKCPRGVVNDIKASRDGRRFMYAEPTADSVGVDTNRTRRVVVWNAEKDREIDQFIVADGTQILGMSESGRLVAYLDPLHVAKLRDIDSHGIVYSLDNGEDAPMSIAIAPDDRSMACITSEGVASVRELFSGRVIATRANLRDLSPSGHAAEWIETSSSVRVIDLSRRGQGIVGNGTRIAKDGRGALRLITEGKRVVERLSDPALTPLPPLTVPAGAYDFTYNGLWGLLDVPGDRVEIVSVDGAQSPVPFPYLLDNFSCASTTDVIVVTRRDRTFAAIEGATGKTLWAKKFNPSFRGIWISPDGRRLIASSFEGQLATIDLRTGTITKMMDAHWLNLSSLNFSRDGRLFLTGGGEGDTVLWDADTLERLMEFHGTGGREIEGGDISPDGKRVVTCNITGAWQIWDRETGKELTEFRASRLPLHSIVFTADGQNVLTAGDDGFVRVWSARNQDPTIRIPLPPTTAARLRGR